MLRVLFAKPIYIKLILIFFLVPVTGNKLWSQKHQNFEAKFTMMERNTLKNTSMLMKGNVKFSKLTNTLIFEINFPNVQKWIVRDSILKKYDGDLVISESVLTGYQDLVVFKELLELKSNDFGLKQHGFEMSDVSSQDGTVYVQWLPPPSFKTFVKYVTTAAKDNLLQGVIFTDIDDKDFNTTLFEEYAYIDDLPIPMRIVQHFEAKEEQIYKTIYFENVQIH